MALTKVQNELIRVYENGPLGFRNKIINGAMEIDQRNGGNSVTPGAGGTYTVDRFYAVEDTDGAVTAQRVNDAPSEFKNSLRITTTPTADAVLSPTQSLFFAHRIEGNNVVDLGWGSSGAKTVTLSFWVKSSIAGVFSGAIRNSARDRAYLFTYTINSTNTWEKETITIPGDVSGTWLKDNLIGLEIDWSLGVGSTFTSASTGWVSGNFISTSASGTPVSIIGTLNATWQITGVQFEEGSQATPFERRPISMELSLCQRYYETGSSYSLFSGYVASGAIYYSPNRYSVTKRAVPVAVTFADIANSGFAAGPPTIGNNNIDGFNALKTATATVPTGYFQYTWSSDAEL